MPEHINGSTLFGGRLAVDDIVAAVTAPSRDAMYDADNRPPEFKHPAYVNDTLVLIGQSHIPAASMEVRVDTYRAS